MHSFYLRNMYIHNRMGKPGGITLAGMPIDLSKVKIPAYFISTVEDHIAPWKTTYKGAKYLGGDVRFVLGGSGHIAGIVNPPAANKCRLFNRIPGSRMMPTRGSQRRHSATARGGPTGGNGCRFLGKEVPPRIPGNGGLKALADAPGTYARRRADGLSPSPRGAYRISKETP